MLTTRKQKGEVEQILNGTSAQCYAVLFTLVHASWKKGRKKN